MDLVIVERVERLRRREGTRLLRRVGLGGVKVKRVEARVRGDGMLDYDILLSAIGLSCPLRCYILSLDFLSVKVDCGGGFLTCSIHQILTLSETYDPNPT